jgi:exonuclease VII large subunit
VVRDAQGKFITDPKKVKTGTLLKLKVAKGDLDATAN